MFYSGYIIVASGSGPDNGGFNASERKYLFISMTGRRKNTPKEKGNNLKTGR